MADAEKTVLKALKALMRGKKGAKEVSLDSNLYDDLELDSLEVAELSAVLEDGLGSDPYSEGLSRGRSARSSSSTSAEGPDHRSRRADRAVSRRGADAAPTSRSSARPDARSPTPSASTAPRRSPAGSPSADRRASACYRRRGRPARRSSCASTAAGAEACVYPRGSMPPTIDELRGAASTTRSCSPPSRRSLAAPRRSSLDELAADAGDAAAAPRAARPR